MSKPQRVGALLLAILFLATAVAFTVAVVIESQRQEQADSSITDSENNPLNNQNSQRENMLQGTKLENFTPIDKVNELQKIDLQEGTGQEVKAGDTITAHYTGALAKDGTIFQSSHDFGEAIEFGLNGVIRGWGEGVPGMKVGGKRRLIIPAELAYGPQEQSGIPANSDLVFDIELVSVKQ